MINNIIPYYQQEFGIDGVMIDMGHALPSELKQRMIETAREIDPDFAFWDENFKIQKSSRNDGYNAVIGHAWAVEAENNGFERTIDEYPIPRLGKASDIAKAALFLASSSSDWITGAIIPVDGGITCCLRAHHIE